jgi:hypothetical protein
MVSYPVAMVLDAAGDLIFAMADAGACVVWSIDSGGNATIVAGVLNACGDGIQAASAYLNGLLGVALDSTGNIYITDTF